MHLTFVWIHLVFGFFGIQIDFFISFFFWCKYYQTLWQLKYFVEPVGNNGKKLPDKRINEIVKKIIEIRQMYAYRLLDLKFLFKILYDFRLSVFVEHFNPELPRVRGFLWFVRRKSQNTVMRVIRRLICWTKIFVAIFSIKLLHILYTSGIKKT